jgi:hypothetical protein
MRVSKLASPSRTTLATACNAASSSDTLDQADQGLPDQFIAAVAQHAAGGFVDFDKAQGLGVDQIDAVAGLVDDGPVLLFAFGQRSRVCAWSDTSRKHQMRPRSAPRVRPVCSARTPGRP